MPWGVLSHTADTGIEATAESLPALVRELCLGMFGLMAHIPPVRAERWVQIQVRSASVEDLVVETLAELLYLSEIEDLFFCEFVVSIGEDGRSATVEAGGIPVTGIEPQGPPVKAVTYHRLTVERREEEWYGRVYFDV